VTTSSLYPRGFENEPFNIEATTSSMYGREYQDDLLNMEVTTLLPLNRVGKSHLLPLTKIETSTDGDDEEHHDVPRKDLDELLIERRGHSELVEEMTTYHTPLYSATSSFVNPELHKPEATSSGHKFGQFTGLLPADDEDVKSPSLSSKNTKSRVSTLSKPDKIESEELQEGSKTRIAQFDQSLSDKLPNVKSNKMQLEENVERVPDKHRDELSISDTDHNNKLPVAKPLAQGQ